MSRNPVSGLALSGAKAKLALVPTIDSGMVQKPTQRARSLLARPRRPESVAALLAAAGFFALSAFGLTLTVVMLPTPWPL